MLDKHAPVKKCIRKEQKLALKPWVTNGIKKYISVREKLSNKKKRENVRSTKPTEIKLLIFWGSAENNSLPWTCLNIPQCTIGIGLRFYILVWSVSGAVFFFFAYNFTILQFSYNFSLFVGSHVFFCFCFFCLFHFVFSWLTDFT